jgi:endoglucanase
VVLNCHHEFWLYSNYTGQITNFENIWSQIAAAFSGEPGSLVFEILNEPQLPMTNAEVNDMNTNILKIIRASNPTRYVMVGADSWNAFNELTAGTFILPDDPYLIANFHYYNPYNFCGNAQGTWGTSSDSNSLSNDLASVSNWAASKNNIPVFMGEYGACNGCDPASRLRWYGAISSYANNDEFAYDCWDDDGTLSTSFQIFYRTQGTFNMSIIDAIFIGN